MRIECDVIGFISWKEAEILDKAPKLNYESHFIDCYLFTHVQLYISTTNTYCNSSMYRLSLF